MLYLPWRETFEAISFNLTLRYGCLPNPNRFLFLIKLQKWTHFRWIWNEQNNHVGHPVIKLTKNFSRHFYFQDYLLQLVVLLIRTMVCRQYFERLDSCPAALSVDRAPWCWFQVGYSLCDTFRGEGKKYCGKEKKNKKISFHSWCTSMNDKNDQNWKPNKNLDSNQNQHGKEQNPFREINNNHRTKSL